MALNSQTLGHVRYLARFYIKPFEVPPKSVLKVIPMQGNVENYLEQSLLVN